MLLSGRADPSFGERRGESGGGPDHRGRERFIEEVRRDDPDLVSYLRIEERELEAGRLN